MMQAATEPTTAPTRRAPEGADAKLRRCVVTGASAPRPTLLRLVVSPEGVLTPDIAGRLPGRGIWVTPDRAVIEHGIARKAYQRALRGPVQVLAGFADLVERLLLQRLLDAIGLARRAGDAVAGAQKAEEWLAAGRVGLLLLARDAGADARRRWQHLPQGAACATVLTADEIGRAFARDRAAQIVVRQGPLMKRLMTDAGRLAGMRRTGSDPAETPQHRDGE